MTSYSNGAGRDVDSIIIELDDGEKIEFNRYALDAGAEVNPGDYWTFVTHADGRHIAYPMHRIRSMRMTLVPIEAPATPCTCNYDPAAPLHALHCDAV